MAICKPQDGWGRTHSFQKENNQTKLSHSSMSWRGDFKAPECH